MEDNHKNVQQALKRKSQAETRLLQQKVDDADFKAWVLLQEPPEKSGEPFPDFDDPTNDIMTDEMRDGKDELSVEMRRRHDHKPKTSSRLPT